MGNGEIDTHFGNDDPAPGSVGLTLRTGSAGDTPNEYNKNAAFAFAFEQGKENYQISDGSGPEKADSGVPFTEAGVIVTVTLNGADTYDLEIHTVSDKKLTKLPVRKLSAAGPITSFAIFNRDGATTDAFFNSLPVARENK